MPTVPFTLETPLDNDAFVILEFKAREKLSGLFEYILVAGTKKTANPARPEPDPGSLLGQSVTVTCDAGSGRQRFFNGIVAEVAEMEPARDMCWYELVLRPNLWLLSLNRRSRIFQSKSATQILAEVASGVGGAMIEVGRTPPMRNYCVQYRETDLEFFLRICSEEGFSHFWIHSREGHQLVVTDNTKASPNAGAMQYNQLAGDAISIDTIGEWTTRRSIRTGAIAVSDTHFQLFNTQLSGQAGVQPAAGTTGPMVNGSACATSWEVPELGTARYFDQVGASGGENPEAVPEFHEWVARRAELQALAAGADALVASGGARNPIFAPGMIFELIDHPSSSGLWMVLEAEHEVAQRGVGFTAETPEIRCVTRFRAAPASVPQKPWPPLPKPVAAGVETAIVTGPEGAETQIDRHGRVKVRFWWDPSDSAGSNTSCWVRVAQTWAGKGYGAFFWPRVGNEVVVAFEHGDPDRPIIVGSVYNSANITPYTLPEMAYMSGFHSKTQGGEASENFHRIVMSDSSGAENILIHAEARLLTTQEKAQVLRRPKSSIEWQ